MIDAGDFTPQDVMPSTRGHDGSVIVPRMTTTEEQYAEVVEFLSATATTHKDNEVRVRVLWSRGDPTILEARFNVEHLSGKRVWLLDKMSQFTESGGEIQHDETVRLRVLNQEIADLHDRGMF